MPRTGRTVAILQARMTSSRLPGKVMADLGGQPMIVAMLGRLRRARRLDAVMVATTVNAADDPVADAVRAAGAVVFRGDEHDVLGRYAAAAEAAGADTVVRVTGDCPLIDPAVVDDVLALFADSDCDYASNVMQRTFPDGLDTEVFTRAALVRADAEVADAFLREHVTTYIRGNAPGHPGDGFRHAHHRFAADFAHVRWTVDRPDDLARVRRLWNLLPDGFGWLEALSAATREPALLGLPA